MNSVNLQSFINANPVLFVIAVFAIGIIMFLAARILLANASCLAHLGCSLVVVIVILVLLRLILFR